MKADIDIDLADRNSVLDLIRNIPARLEIDGQARPHNSGVYVTDIPQDVLRGCAALDYQTAEQRGYFKIDLLNMSVYQLIKDQAHLEQMLATDPPWHRLWQEPDWAKQLVHVGNYTGMLAQMKPSTVPQMAAFISIIRPGKAHLQGKPWAEIFATVWDGDDSRGYSFKKSHAVSYSALVALHMNLLNQ